MATTQPVEAIIAAIDAMHRSDPNGAELSYAERMSHWLGQLNAQPDPALAIAVRAQHLKRWECPRGDYPTGRPGYLRWRQAAARHHVRLVAELLEQFAVDPTFTARIGLLVEKRDTGPDGQMLEDCACLTFLETRLAEFRGEHPPEDVERILERTRKKMSSAARELATVQGFI